MGGTNAAVPLNAGTNIAILSCSKVMSFNSSARLQIKDDLNPKQLSVLIIFIQREFVVSPPLAMTKVSFTNMAIW